MQIDFKDTVASNKGQRLQNLKGFRCDTKFSMKRDNGTKIVSIQII